MKLAAVQTETGAILISGLPGAWDMKPGCASLPFFGVQPVLVNEKVRRVPSSSQQGSPLNNLLLVLQWILPEALCLAGSHKIENPDSVEYCLFLLVQSCSGRRISNS